MLDPRADGKYFKYLKGKGIDPNSIQQSKDIINRDTDHTKKHPDQKNDILFEPVKTK